MRMPADEPSGAGQPSVRYRAELLQTCTARVLGGMGAPPDLAQLVGQSLVLSNLVGHDSHGIIRLLEYAGWVRQGHLVPDARPHVAWQETGTSLVDGGWGWGQASATLATQLIIRMTRSSGCAAVVIARCNHVGRLGEYVNSIADAGMMGLAFCNTGGAVVAPYGGVRRVLGTNPFAWAVPGSGSHNLVLDFSTAVIAAGKVVLAGLSGTPIEPGALLDAQGQPSTRAEDLDSGGVLLAFGRHKGSGLSVLIDVVAGLLSGTLPACVSESGFGNGTVLIAIDLARFVAPENFRSVSAEFAAKMYSASPAIGPTVLLPGELEAATEAERRRDGVVIPAGVRRNLVDLAAQFDVAVPELA
jgi:LDH2 family malate/lactate/ureidoglycolate dehydrogenase